MGDIIDYIKTELDKGFAKEDIENALIKAGYSAEDVKTAFSQISVTPAVLDRPRKNLFLDRKYWMFSGIALLVIAIGVIMMVSFSGDPSTPKPEPSKIKEPINKVILEQSQEYLDCFYPTWAMIATCEAWATGNNSVCRDIAVQDQLLCDTLALTKNAFEKGIQECMRAEGDARIGCEAFMKIDSSGCAQASPAANEVCILFAGAKRSVETKNKGMCQGLPKMERMLCEAVIENSLPKCREIFTDEECRQYL